MMIPKNKRIVNKKAQKLYANDYLICEKCLKRNSVDVHHIVYKSAGGSDIPSNFIALCRLCHDWAHGKTKDSQCFSNSERGEMLFEHKGLSVESLVNS